MVAEVQDVTFAEQLVGKNARSEDWQEGLDLGLDFAAKRNAQLTLDLSTCRTKLAKALTQSEASERLCQHYKAEAQWWKEEHDRVRDEFNAFTREMVRRFVK